MIGHVDYHVTNHCNLNCARCNQFATLAEPWFISYEEFCEEWQFVHDKGLNFGEIRVLGGETLLHPELDKLLVFLRSVMPKSDITVYTNGILLGQQKEKLLPVFKENRIILYVSQYPNLKLDFGKLKEGFPWARGTYAASFMSTSLHTTPDFNADDSFNNCNNSKVWQCRILKNKKIYPCSMVPNLPHLINYFPELKDTPLGQINIEENGIDIETHTVQEIEALLNKSMPICAFCNARAAKKLYPWSQSEYKISEWIEK